MYAVCGNSAAAYVFLLQRVKFRIQVFTGRVLTRAEIITIGKVILSDETLVRKLVILGWDTLEVHGDKGTYGCKWQLKDFILLPE